MTRQIEVNRLKTFGENVWNFSKAAALPTAAVLGLNYLGSTDYIKATFGSVLEASKHGGSFVTGLATGILKNAVLIGSTLKNLQGKTEGGDYQPMREDADGTLTFQVPCVDKRRINKSGGAVAGSFGPMGSEFVGLAKAMLVQGFLPNNILGDFATGYFLGGNILTEIYSHANLLGEVIKIASNPEYKNRRIKIEMMDHWDGCGAEGFTSPLTYLLKFKAHKLTLADLNALPNEVAGYIYVNGVLSPLIGLLSGGRVSLSAVLKHSEMSKGH